MHSATLFMTSAKGLKTCDEICAENRPCTYFLVWTPNIVRHIESNMADTEAIELSSSRYGHIFVPILFMENG